MTKSTFDEESENRNLMKESFPSFRTIPARLLKAAQCLGRGWKKSWHYLLTIIVIIAIAYTALDIYATAQLNHQLNLIRQKGEPVTIADVIPSEVPDSENAAILYNRAVAVLKSNGLNVEFGDVPTTLDKKTPAFLTKNAKAVKLIRQATEMPQCRFDIDWQHLLISRNPELGQMRDLTRLLSLQAQYEAKTGNVSTALDDVRRCYLMVGNMSGETTLIGALSQLAMEAIANRALAKVLLSSSLTREQAFQFQASLPMINWKMILHRALLTERTFTIDYTGWVHFFKPFSRLDVASGLYFWQKIIENAANTPVPVPLDYDQEIKKQIQQIPWYARMSKMVLPVYVNTRKNFDWGEVQHREREIAFALAAYHSQYHKYPDTLHEAETFWKSTFPLDPYSNKSFHYKKQGYSFLLYSIGVNRKDDGGVREPKKGKDDIVWGH